MTKLDHQLRIEWAYLESGGSPNRAAERLEDVSSQVVRSYIFNLRREQGLSGDQLPELGIQECLRVAREGLTTHEIAPRLGWPVETVADTLDRWAGIESASTAKREAVERKFSRIKEPTISTPALDPIAPARVIPPPILDDDERRELRDLIASRG